MNWYYALNGQQHGPVPEQELTRLVTAGNLNAGTLIWRDGLADWQPLGTALPAALGIAAADVPQIGGFALAEEQKDVVVQQMREGVTLGMPGSVAYAGFWIRFVAKFIDGLILMVPQLGIQMLMMAAMGANAPKPLPGQAPTLDATQVLMLLATMAIGITIQALYNIILVTKYGATWGKMALGLKIVMEDGSKLSAGRATGRFFAELVSGLTLYVGYIIAAFDSEKRALHDHICSTRVIKTH